MEKLKIGRTLIFGGFALLIVLFAWEVFAADEMRVIEVRRNIPLADNDPVYRDYYINAGLEAGLKPNQVVTAVRKINAKDAAGSQSFGELLIPVGQIKIIFAQSHLSVAREYRLLSRDDLPMLEQMGILIGDQVDLKGSFVDNRKSSAKTTQKEKATNSSENHSESQASTTPAPAPVAPVQVPIKAPASEAPKAAIDPFRPEQQAPAAKIESPAPALKPQELVAKAEAAAPEEPPKDDHHERVAEKTE